MADQPNQPPSQPPEAEAPDRSRDREWREHQLRRAEYSMRDMLTEDGGWRNYLTPLEVNQGVPEDSNLVDEGIIQRLTELAEPVDIGIEEPAPLAMQELEPEPFERPPEEIQAPGLRLEPEVAEEPRPIENVGEGLIDAPEFRDPAVGGPPLLPEEPEPPEDDLMADGIPLAPEPEVPPEPPEEPAAEAEPDESGFLPDPFTEEASPIQPPGAGRPLKEGETREDVIREIREGIQQREQGRDMPDGMGPTAHSATQPPPVDFGELGATFFELESATDTHLHDEAERATDSVMNAGEKLLELLRRITQMAVRMDYLIGNLLDRVDSEDDCDGF